MIPKANVKTIGLHKAGNIFSVAGYEDKLGYYPAWQKRIYHSYEQALKYSLKLKDYYQVEVVEF